MVPILHVYGSAHGAGRWCCGSCVGLVVVGRHTLARIGVRPVGVRPVSAARGWSAWLAARMSIHTCLTVQAEQGHQSAQGIPFAPVFAPKTVLFVGCGSSRLRPHTIPGPPGQKGGTPAGAADLAPCRREQRKTLSSRCAQHRSGAVTQQQRKRRDVLTYMAAPRWPHIRFVRLTSPAEIEAFTGAIEAVHAGARRR
jgi:hypothetical protein